METKTTYAIKIGGLRRGDKWLRVYEETSPIASL